MAVDMLNTTTLSEALTTETSDFTVASTTNIVADQLLVVGGEAMKVQSIPVSGRVKVYRGFTGTKAVPHASGDRAFIGDPTDFTTIKENAVKLLGDAGVLPDYLLPGQRAFDSKGNEYVMVELSQTSYAGTTVLISRDGNYTAIPLFLGLNGSVGVTAEAGTSDQYVWAQVYGRHAHAQLVGGSSLATSTGVLQPASSVSTPAVGLFAGTTSLASSVQHGQIYGMHIVGACSSATTSATSATGYFAPVWLNYPFVMRIASS